MPITGKSERRKIPYMESTDPTVLHEWAKLLAEALDNDAETGQGKLSERPAAKVRGRFFYVTGDTEANNNILWWDTGGTWIAINEITTRNQSAGLLLESGNFPSECVPSSAYQKGSINDAAIEENRVLIASGGERRYVGTVSVNAVTNNPYKAAGRPAIAYLTATAGAFGVVIEWYANGVHIGTTNYPPEHTFDQMIWMQPNGSWEAVVHAGEVWNLTASYLEL